MTTLNFTVTLLEDVIFSERSATTGGHTTLDYLPGSAFLGYCASKLYTSLRAKAFDVFHSGRVRFGNAYPLTPDATPMIPVPLCWHLEKGKSIKDHGEDIVNLINTDEIKFAEWEKVGIQQKQIRSGYVCAKKHYLIPDRQFRLKTAIDRGKRGRSADNQLFGYESIAAGSNWYFSIDIDAGLGDGIDEQLKECLDNKTFRIGHSRTAEYGLAHVKSVNDFKASFADGSVTGNLLLIYALSDLALRDPMTGAPTLQPTERHFQLPQGTTFAANKSYLRIRSYAPFNGHRRAFDLERQVIGKGSVLAFEKETCDFNQDEIDDCRAALVKGVGSYRHDGLGRVLVQPKFLESDFVCSLITVSAPAIQGPVTISLPPAPTPFQSWLLAKAGQINEDNETIVEVTEWINQLVTETSLEHLPRNSQWGQLRNIAMNATSRDHLIHLLFEEKTGFCYHGISEIQWKKSFHSDTSYRNFLEETVIGSETDFARVRSRIYLLANRLPHKVNQLIRKKESV